MLQYIRPGVGQQHKVVLFFFGKLTFAFAVGVTIIMTLCQQETKREAAHPQVFLTRRSNFTTRDDEGVGQPNSNQMTIII